ncbi:hypothetical protein AA0113_g11692 [Alternaria arborescens]|uniref:Cyanovirin-N domain-containing protein n=1 Tax=Alternaria arborescens TaxID=156630 RepID=A0A4Q4Q4H1_9PLEO|nr:hypothetical protein AA0111_g10868 [Alternaria arborescens]RYN17167.1 hypothetical protein AA0112_g12176 [Alternaria arborescens]RYO18114.1 hypothetical protein AA0111_g10868 [Alternaria arborescens]RYO33395.1 hypothetical protein AA0113_g11692 [Alternaria arborescens]
MNPTPVLKLALVDRCQLYVEYQTPLDELSGYVLPLDTKIGNHEGSFHPGGNHFSFSARNIVLEQNILCAELKNSRGDWWYDQLEVIVNVSTDRTPVSFSVEFRRYDPDRLQGCYNIRLIDQRLLAAEFPGPNGKVKDIYIDLKHYLGVKDGAFDSKGRNFSSSVQNAHMIGTTLCATHNDGHPISIALSRVLQFKNGSFSPLRVTKNEDLDYEVLTDLSDRRWLSNADSPPKLINYKQKRAWYLIANCLNSRGSYQESTIRLHDIIGPGDDEMFTFFSERPIPEHARETRLENGILTASFDAGDEKWIQRSFDLAELVTNEGGALAK